MDWITIATFTYPTEMAILKGHLEAEGIECRAKDEFTVQVNNFYSNAIGGVKLQVKAADLEKAKAILIAADYKFPKPAEPSVVLKAINNFTQKIPGLRSVKPEKRFFIFSGVMLILLVSALFFILKPSLKEELIKGPWCLSYIEYEGEKIVPNGTGLTHEGYYRCDNELGFYENGYIFIPGFDSRFFKGSWFINKDKLEIYDTENFQQIFNGVYVIDISFKELILSNEATKIYCYKPH